MALVVSRLISNAEPNVAKVDIWDKDRDIEGGATVAAVGAIVAVRGLARSEQDPDAGMTAVIRCGHHCNGVAAQFGAKIVLVHVIFRIRSRHLR